MPTCWSSLLMLALLKQCDASNTAATIAAEVDARRKHIFAWLSAPCCSPSVYAFY